MCMSLESLFEEGERSWVALSSVTRYLIIVSQQTPRASHQSHSTPRPPLATPNGRFH